MQFILDNLVALIVAGVLLMGLQVTQVRSQHASIEQVASHSVKAKTLVFGEWVEDDVLNIGANFGSNLYRFESPVLDPDTGNTTNWVFYSDTTGTDGVTRRVFKQYRLVERGQSAFRDTTYQLYQVARDSAVVGEVDVYKVDFIRVRFGVVPEYVLKPDNYIRELYWTKTLKVRPYWVPPPSLDS